MSELKPCPFCGGEADYRTENFGGRIWVQCTVCGVSTSRYDANEVVDRKDGKAWATQAWQRRACRG